MYRTIPGVVIVLLVSEIVVLNVMRKHDVCGIIMNGIIIGGN
jgi:hypothetical protein